jgi:hypothetical protein
MSPRPALPTLALLLAAAVASVATSVGRQCQDWRFPSDGETGWDAGAPLVLSYGDPDFLFVAPSSDTVAFLEGVRIFGPEGEEVPFFAVTEEAKVVLCPEGGLRGDAEYTWTVGPFDESSPNELEPIRFAHTGRWSFRTGPVLTTPARSEEDCRDLAAGLPHAYCGFDTGDTGESDPPDTDDSDP